MTVSSSLPESSKVSILPFAGTVTVRFSDAVIASTDRAKVLIEPGLDSVYYIPFDDIYFEFLSKTNTTSRCPVKGMTSYWRVSAAGEGAKDVMWAYETPNPVAAQLARHGAFDERFVRIEVNPTPDAWHDPGVLE
jgi:uncharacterized protein (DUF427 family)